MSNAISSNPDSTNDQSKDSMGLGVLARQRQAHDTNEADAPGVVIPGERLSDSQMPDSSESYKLVSIGKKAHVIAYPIPSDTSPGYAAITDYLNCSFPFKADSMNLPTFFNDFAAVGGKQFLRVVNRGKGMNGYEHSYELGDDGAKFCYGGQRDTALLMLPGKVCHTIADWNALVVLMRDRYGARITRWDAAVDDYEGTHSINWAVNQLKEGNFTNGGNKPSCRQNGNWIEPDGKGRTIYIGKRENGKMLRVYEKGMQSGEPWHPWVRWEVELHNVDRVVPWDVLINPGKYVAGAYPKAMSWVQDEMCRVKTVRSEIQLSYKHLVGCASTAYGRLLNVMLEVEESPQAVIDKLRKDGLPKRLQMPVVAAQGK